MRASLLPGFSTWLKSSPLSGDRIWSRPLGGINPVEVQLFYARAGLLGLKPFAIDAIERMQAAMILAGAAGLLTRAEMRLVVHQPPSDPYLVDQFLDSLVKLRPARRAAVLFALTTQRQPSWVTELTWHEVSRITQIKAEAREILQAQIRVRHLKLPYVFWEWVNTRIAAPVLDLERDAYQAFECTWPALQAKFDDMIWLSGRSDCASFLGLMDEVGSGKL